MIITEVRVKLPDATEGHPRRRLLAYVSVVLDDCFVVHELKIIQGNTGPFVSMPSRKLAGHCLGCHSKVPVIDEFCGCCGRPMPVPDVRDEKFYVDVAHPITQEFRRYLEEEVIRTYEHTLRGASDATQVPGLPIDRDQGGPEAPVR